VHAIELAVSVHEQPREESWQDPSSHVLSTMSRLPLLARCLSTSAPRPALSPLARPAAENISAAWKGTSMTGGTTKNFIGGHFLESKADTWLDVFDPVGPLQLVQHSSGHAQTVNANLALKSSSDHG